MAASDRKEQLQSEINLQNALVDSVKTHLFLSEKGRDVKTQLLDKLQEEKELGNQIESIQKAALSGCPSDAIDEVRDIVSFPSNFPGGKGAVYEICMYLLKQRKSIKERENTNENITS
jgi:3-deoxy-D-manno-octulosonate 8-phosphate phosphatase (KDO 8-P phosphatase)